MANKPRLDRKTLLVGDGIDDISSVLERYTLMDLRCNIDRMDNAIDASRAVKYGNYPLIILPCRTPPGSEYPYAIEFPEIKETWERAKSWEATQEEKYFDITLQIIKYARESNNPNKDALIVISDVYHPQGDSLISNVRIRSLEAGADSYIYMMEKDARKQLFDLVSSKLGWERRKSK
ncbi:MAG: hypothetical protein WC867_08085 [Candidatus Pacearchaeota archaeon]|jgi:hypothetical protein